MGIQKLFVTISIVFIFIFFQNCSEFESNVSENKDVSSELSIAELSLKVDQIIAESCVACHGNGKGDGGFSSVQDLNLMIKEGVIVPGDLHSSFYQEIISGRMPIGIPRLSFDEENIIRRWIKEMPPIINEENLSCNLSTNKTEIIEGDEVVVSMTSTGTVLELLINGEVKNISNGKTFVYTPILDTQYLGVVKNGDKEANCNSEIVKVTPKSTTDEIKCELSVDRNLVSINESVLISMKITGEVIEIKFDDESITDLSKKDFSFNKQITKPSNFIAQIKDAMGNSASCNVEVNVKELTKAEYYIAKLGPNNSSVDDIVTDAGHCYACHSADSTSTRAKDLFILELGKPMVNLQTLQNVRGQGDTTSGELCKLITISGASRFSAEEKSFLKGFCVKYDESKLTEQESFEFKIEGVSVNDIITRPNQCMKCHTNGALPDEKYNKAPLKYILGNDAIANLAAIKSVTRKDLGNTTKRDLTVGANCGLLTIATSNHAEAERGTLTQKEQDQIKTFCSDY